MNLQVRIPAGKVLAGSARTLSARLEKSGSTFTGISARGTTYNLGIVPDDGAANWDGTATAQTINAGALTVMKSASTTATGSVAPGAQSQKIAAWDFVVKGEDLRSTSTTIGLTLGTMERTEVTGCTLKKGDGTVVAGPVDANATPAAVFSTTVTFPVGTNTYALYCNIASTVSANDTIAGTMTPSTGTTLTGVTSGNSVTATPATAVAGNTLTVAAGALTITNLGTPPASTVVAGAQGLHAATVNLSASASSSGEDVRVTSVTITDTTSALADGDDIINISLKDKDGKLLADIKQPTGSNAADANPTYVFALSAPITVATSSDYSMYLYIDVKSNMAGTAGATHTFAIAAVGDVVATGVTTGSTLAAGVKTLNGAGQALTLQSTGTLTISADASNPVAGVVVAGRSGIVAAVYKFVGARENVQMRKVNVTRTSTTGSDADFAKVYLYDGDTKLGEAVFSNGTASFDITTKNFTVDRLGNPKKLTIKVDLNSTLAGATSGNDFRLDLAAIAAGATGAPLGLSSGSGIALANTTGSVFQIRKTVPTFTKNVANTTALIPGNMDFYLDVTAAPEADVKFDAGTTAGTYAAGEGMLRFSITQATGTSTARTVSLIRKSSNTTLSTHTYDLTTASGALVFNFASNALTVAAGTTETLIVRIDLQDYSSTGETFQLTLGADTSTTLAATNAVRWNDDASGDASDYNGYGITSLPVTHAFVKS